MRERTTLDGDDSRLPTYPLRVFRIEPGYSVYARLLSDRYWGLFTHWVKGKSVYCDGTACNPSMHRAERIWKGYAAVEIWESVKCFWVPSVLEITENLELDFRGRWKRGQVWIVKRDQQTGRKKTPVRAELLEERNPTTFPSAFDIVPCLRHLYHRDGLMLESKNPLPPRQAMSPSQGAPPVDLAAGEDNESLRRSFAEHWQKLRAADKAKTNGHIDVSDNV